jgi:RHS repeat-associated protein
LSAVNYTYDDYGRFHSVTSSVHSASTEPVESVVNYSYLENSSLIAGYTSPNGFEATKSYEPNRNLITEVKNQFDNTTISQYNYANDEIGRRTQRIDTMANTTTNTFGYNNRSELIDAALGLDDYGYNYDQIGNRITVTSSVDSVSSVVNYQANQLNQYTNISYGQGSSLPSYDADGNMLTHGDWTYTWNGENRMTSASNCVDNTYITYSYDYQGRMIQKVTDGETILFYWDGNHVIAEMTDSTTNLYTWSHGETLTASLGGETVFYAHDANKNITDLLDDSGSHLVHYDYSPFGEESSTVYSSPFTVSLNPFGFSNEYFDETTGLVEYKYRPYFPQLGKFLSLDPIEESGGINLYGIGGNDLINNWDEWGLSEDEVLVVVFLTATDADMFSTEITTNC